MIGGQDAVTRATAVVLVDGRRQGSAVLVDGRHLLTAAHVLRHQGQPVDTVEIVFGGPGLYWRVLTLGTGTQVGASSLDWSGGC